MRINIAILSGSLLLSGCFTFTNASRPEPEIFYPTIYDELPSAVCVEAASPIRREQLVYETRLVLRSWTQGLEDFENIYKNIRIVAAQVCERESGKFDLVVSLSQLRYAEEALDEAAKFRRVDLECKKSDGAPNCRATDSAVVRFAHINGAARTTYILLSPFVHWLPLAQSVAFQESAPLAPCPLGSECAAIDKATVEYLKTHRIHGKGDENFHAIAQSFTNQTDSASMRMHFTPALSSYGALTSAMEHIFTVGRPESVRYSYHGQGAPLFVTADQHAKLVKILRDHKNERQVGQSKAESSNPDASH